MSELQENELENIVFQILNIVSNNQDMPNKLYHYTQTNSCINILEKKAFWASSFESTNDKFEFRKGLKIIKENLNIIYDIFKENGIKIDQKILENFFNSEIENPKLRPYFACFSENGTSDVNWKRYANLHSGVRIDLELIKVDSKEEVSSNNLLNGIWAQVNYSEEELLLAFTFYVHTALVALKNKKITSGHPKFLQLMEIILTVGAFMASVSYKDSFWKDEKEWRFVVFANPKIEESILPHGQILYRARQNDLVDYLEVGAEKAGIKIIGAEPGVNFDQFSKNALRLLLKQTL